MVTHRSARYSLLGAFGLLLSTTSISATPDQGEALPRPEAPFPGKVGRSTEDSVPGWPARVTAPEGAPNVVLIMLDDVGFAASSTFGGPSLTPALSALAGRGLRYNRMQTTALCSPTRAALLTGRNHHRVGFGTVSQSAVGYPGYNGLWPKSVASIAEVLRQNGFSTAAFGKWHNTPMNEVSPVGPFDRWPTSLGFEQFYGIMEGATSETEPQLYQDTRAVPVPAPANRTYYFTTDITDQAISWVHTHETLAPDKPYFLYFATAATHQPLHAPKEWIEKYRGKFDGGWDALRDEIFARQQKLGVIPVGTKLTPRPDSIPAWDTMSPDAKRLLARQMEVYAGFLAYTDYEVGRLLKEIEQGPDADNTLVIYIVGDNGAEGGGGLIGGDAAIARGLFDVPNPLEDQLKHIDGLGGPEYDNGYATGWAWALGSPFQWVKGIASHFGGTANPMVVSWPERIAKPGGLRSQFTHVVDVAPTIYEAVGVRAPKQVNGVEQMSIDGTSFLYSLNDARAQPDSRTQYFEMSGNRSIYKDGWKAAARHSITWVRRHDNKFDDDPWELYNVARDFSEAHDLAAKYPEKLAELRELFEQEAHRNNVYPLVNPYNFEENRKAKDPQVPFAGQKSFIFHGDFQRNSVYASPTIMGSHRITADVVIPRGGAEGIILTDGGRFGGFTLYLKDNHPVYESNFFGISIDMIASDQALPEGRVRLEYRFDKTDPKPKGGGIGRLYVNGEQVAERAIAQFGVHALFSSSFEIGRSSVSPVGKGYANPFPFTGTIETVAIELE